MIDLIIKIVHSPLSTSKTKSIFDFIIFYYRQRDIVTNSLRNKKLFYIGNRQHNNVSGFLVRVKRIEKTEKPIKIPRSYKTPKLFVYVSVHTRYSSTVRFRIYVNLKHHVTDTT